jgi:uncharacterized membrane protein
VCVCVFVCARARALAVRWVSACVGTQARASECACVALLIQHAKFMRRILICDFSGLTMFSDIIYKVVQI